MKKITFALCILLCLTYTAQAHAYGCYINVVDAEGSLLGGTDGTRTDIQFETYVRAQNSNFLYWNQDLVVTLEDSEDPGAHFVDSGTTTLAVNTGAEYSPTGQALVGKQALFKVNTLAKPFKLKVSSPPGHTYNISCELKWNSHQRCHPDSEVVWDPEQRIAACITQTGTLLTIETDAGGNKISRKHYGLPEFPMDPSSITVSNNGPNQSYEIYGLYNLRDLYPGQRWGQVFRLRNNPTTNQPALQLFQHAFLEGSLTASDRQNESDYNSPYGGIYGLNAFGILSRLHWLPGGTNPDDEGGTWNYAQLYSTNSNAAIQPTSLISCGTQGKVCGLDSNNRLHHTWQNNFSVLSIPGLSGLAPNSLVAAGSTGRPVGDLYGGIYALNPQKLDVIRIWWNSVSGWQSEKAMDAFDNKNRFQKLYPSTTESDRPFVTKKSKAILRHGGGINQSQLPADVPTAVGSINGPGGLYFKDERYFDLAWLNSPHGHGRLYRYTNTGTEYVCPWRDMGHHGINSSIYAGLQGNRSLSLYPTINYDGSKGNSVIIKSYDGEVALCKYYQDATPNYQLTYINYKGPLQKNW